MPPSNEFGRVDHYWNAVFQIKTTTGTLKYTKLPPLIKAILAFQNGNAAVERSLSDNKNSVTSERTDLMDKTIVGLRLMKEYARKHGGAHKVPMTTEMINSMKEAKKMDDQRLKEKAEKKKLNDAEKEKLEEAKKQAEACSWFMIVKKRWRTKIKI